MNEVLRDQYIDDCQEVMVRWNAVLENQGIGSFRFRLPDKRFHRGIGMYADHRFSPEGKELTAEEWEKRKWEWLPDENARAYVRHLMAPVLEVGKIANWIARPAKGIKGKPWDFEYVRTDQGS